MLYYPEKAIEYNKLYQHLVWYFIPGYGGLFLEETAVSSQWIVYICQNKFEWCTKCLVM